MKNRKFIASILLSGLMASGVAQANLVTNGGFESPNVTETYLSPGSTSITGWTVVGNKIAHQDTAAYGSLGVVASEGTQFLELSGVVGRGGGVVSDAFATNIGSTYNVLFDIGAFFVRGQGSFGNVIVDLWLNGEKKGSFSNTQSLTSAGSDWETKSFDFLATSTLTKIGFTSSLSLDSSSYGVGLDNIRVEQVATAPSAVPVPAALPLMLSGLGVLGFASRRRKNTV